MGIGSGSDKICNLAKIVVVPPSGLYRRLAVVQCGGRLMCESCDPCIYIYIYIYGWILVSSTLVAHLAQLRCVRILALELIQSTGLIAVT